LLDIYKYPLAKFLVSKHFGIDTTDQVRMAVSEKYRQMYAIDLKAIHDEIEHDTNLDGFQVQERW